jgi:hypothetical protein
MDLDLDGPLCYPTGMDPLDSEVAAAIETLEQYYLDNVRPARPLRVPN